MVDVLSDTLRVVRLTGAIFLNMRLTSPWAAESEPPQILAEYLRLPSNCIALFHILVRGQCWIHAEGYAPVLMRAGDAILLPHSTTHVMKSDLYTNLAPTPMRQVLPLRAPEGIVLVEDSGSGETTEFICGFLHCDQRFNPLLSALPALIEVRRHDDDEAEGTFSPSANGVMASPILSVAPGDWLGSTLQHMVEESRCEHLGSDDMLARLSEILFVEVVRRYMQSLSPTDHGWLAGVSDTIVGKTLQLLHAQPAHMWTVEELADAVAVSRSTLAQRFAAIIGETPMRYLAGWRIQLAMRFLKETDLNLAEIAPRVGYESEAAFKRAFKRHVGHPPATWRAVGEHQQDDMRARVARAHVVASSR